MILILTDGLDVSTQFVCDWLNKYDANYTVLNPSDVLKNLKNIRINNSKIEKLDFGTSKTINIQDISVVWKRRWRWKILTNKSNFNDLEKAIEFETKCLDDYFMSFFKCKIIGDCSALSSNKYYQMKVAHDAGFKVPDTLLTSCKSDFIDFLNEKTNIITKSNVATFNFSIDGELFANYTTQLNDEMMQNIPDKILPSMVQEKIEKIFEIRVFYWFGRTYSMGIFSQLDEQTNLDYRRYNNNKPNRMLPIPLPPEVIFKIKKIAKCLKLDDFSMDLIFSDKKEYVFLELNTSGVFSNVSGLCNYNLEKIIANKLIEYETSMSKISTHMRKNTAKIL